MTVPLAMLPVSVGCPSLRLRVGLGVHGCDASCRSPRSLQLSEAQAAARTLHARLEALVHAHQHEVAKCKAAVEEARAEAQRAREQGEGGGLCSAVMLACLSQS